MFKFVEHTADMYIEAKGKTLEESFAECALGMEEMMIDTKKVSPKIKKEIKVESEDLKSLLYDFLEQFLIMKDAENLVFSKIKVKKITKGLHETNFILRAEAWGEEFNAKKHEDRTHIKSPTYHGMEIDEKKNKIKVLVDI